MKAKKFKNKILAMFPTITEMSDKHKLEQIAIRTRREDTFDNTFAEAEGWSLFRIDKMTADSKPVYAIQRVDDAAPDVEAFESDDAAISSVRRLAGLGSEYHSIALSLSVTPAKHADAESSGFDHAPWAQQVPILQTLLNKRASSEPRFAGATIAYKPGAEYRPGEYELSLKHEGRFRVVGIVYVKPLSEDTWQEVTIVPDDGEVDWGYHIYGTHTQPIDLEDAETALTKLLDKIVAGFSSTELRIPKDTCNQCQYFTGKKKHGFYRCHTGNCPALSLAFSIKKRKNT